MIVFLAVAIVVGVLFLAFANVWSAVTESTVLAAITFVGVVLQFFPLSGFYKPVTIAGVDLIKLRRKGDDNNKYYVELKGKQFTFAYDIGREYKFKGLAYEERTLKGKVKIYEEEKCTSPVMQKIIIRPERFWTFAPFSTRIEYIFYVPCGTVQKIDDGIKNNSCIV